MCVYVCGAQVPRHTFSNEYTPSTLFGSLVCCYIYKLAGCKLLGIPISLPPISLYECWNCRNLPLWLTLLGFWKYELRNSHLYMCFIHQPSPHACIHILGTLLRKHVHLTFLSIQNTIRMYIFNIFLSILKKMYKSHKERNKN